jgi:hypothetical protein
MRSALEVLNKKEARIIAAARAPGVTVEKIKTAMTG